MKKLSQEKEQEVRVRFKDRLQDLSSYHNTQYEKIQDDLEYRSGNQWQPKVEKERTQDGRPCLVNNQINTMCTRVVNALRVNPVGIEVKFDDNAEIAPGLTLTDLIQGKIRDIEASSRAKEAYECAFDTQVPAGLGFIHVETNYKDDTSLNQDIKICSVPNPLSVYLDPFSKEIDGSDAEYGLVVNYMDADKAKDMYGPEASSGAAPIDLYEYWSVPNNSVPDMLYYEKSTEKQKRYFLLDGSYTDEEVAEEEMYLVQEVRDISVSIVNCYRFVGQMLVGVSKKNIPYIPIVPVYGDRLHLEREGRIYWGGLVHWGKDSQTMINYYASNELELAANAPKNPWIMAEGQDEGHEDEWDTANTRSYSSLKYKPTTLNGNPVPPPFRADNQPQTAGLIQSRQAAMQDLQRQTGIFDNVMGQIQSASQSGLSQQIMSRQGELNSAQYLDNLTQSVAQVGRIVLSLMPYVYDTPREHFIVDDEGNRQKIMVDFSQILNNQMITDAEVKVSSGPAYESRRQEIVDSLMNIGQIMPDKMPAMADIIARNWDTPEANKIADRFAKMLPPELQDQGEEAPDPQAMMAMQEQQAVIAEQEQALEYLNNVVSQLQAALMDNQKDRETDLAKTQMQEESDLAQTRIKAEADLQKELIKQGSETERQDEKLEAEATRDMASIAAKVIEKEVERDIPAPNPDDFVPLVEGPVAPVRVQEADTALDVSPNAMGE